MVNFLLRVTRKDLTFKVDVEEKWPPKDYIRVSWAHKDKCSNSSHIKVPPEALLVSYLIWKRWFKTLGRLNKCSISFTGGVKIEKVFINCPNGWKSKNSGELLSLLRTSSALRISHMIWVFRQDPRNLLLIPNNQAMVHVSIGKHSGDTERGQ